MAVKIALEADFPFTKIITPGKLVEMASDAAKIRAIYKVCTRVSYAAARAMVRIETSLNIFIANTRISGFC